VQEILTCLMMILPIYVTYSALAQVPPLPQEGPEAEAPPRKKPRVEFPEQNPVTKHYLGESPASGAGETEVQNHCVTPCQDDRATE
jgi:hypothetical protein